MDTKKSNEEKELLNNKSKAYYQKNKEKIKAYAKKYRKENREKIKGMVVTHAAVEPRQASESSARSCEANVTP